MAIRLTKKTKYNFAWMLITIGLASLLIRRIVEFIPLASDIRPMEFRLLYVWIGAVASMFFALGVILIRRIFSYMNKVESERRKTENQMLASVIAAEESERRRLSQELHDGLGPIMSSIKMSISAIQRETENPHQKKIAENINLMVQEAIKSVKDISANLSPHMLTNLGLEKALSNFVKKINASGDITFKLSTNSSDTRLDGKIETIIYRVACELINNTIKHADANQASIKLNIENTHLTLNYKDDGYGFDLDQVLKHREGMGISNIYSRIASLNGSIDIISNIGLGTKINIYVPLKNNER